MDPDLKDIQSVLRTYGIGQARLHALPGHSNRNIRVQASAGTFVLRRYSRAGDTWWNRRRSDRASIRYEHAVLRHVAASGIPCVVPLRTKAGSTCVVRRDRYYSLFRFVPSQPYTDSRSAGVIAASVLGRLHEAMGHYGTVEQRPWRGYRTQLRDWFHLQQRGLPTVDDLMAWVHGVTASTPIESIIAARRPVLDDALAIVAQAPQDAYDRFPVIVNHGDYRAENLAWADGRVAAIFDFDDCQRDLRVLDLGALLSDFAGPCFREWDMEHVAAMVRAYRERADICSTELSLLPHLAVASHLHLCLCGIGTRLQSPHAKLDRFIERRLDALADSTTQAHRLSARLATL